MANQIVTAYWHDGQEFSACIDQRYGVAVIAPRNTQVKENHERHNASNIQRQEPPRS